MTPKLQAAIEPHYHIRLGPGEILTGGYECQVWCVESNRGALVIGISPAWRTRVSAQCMLCSSEVAILPGLVA